MITTSHGTWVEPPQPPPLARGEVHLWRVPVPSSGAEPSAWRGWLNAEERERLARKHRPIDAQRELTSRACLRSLLGAYLNRAPETLIFASEAGGKPVLADAPIRERLEFNVSHAGDWVVLAFAFGIRVGVDIEPWSHLDFDELMRGFFAPDEKAAWAAVPASERRATFFSAWTRKEAYLKALGIGLGKRLDSFAVRFTPREAPAELLWCADDPHAATRWKLISFTIAEEYSGALAVEAAAAKLLCFTYNVQPATEKTTRRMPSPAAQ